MIKKMLILLLLIPSLVFAHGGEDHGDAKKEGAKIDTAIVGFALHIAAGAHHQKLHLEDSD